MRLAALIVLAAACGGSGQRAASPAVPEAPEASTETPGPVTHPERGFDVELARERSHDTARVAAIEVPPPFQLGQSFGDAPLPPVTEQPPETGCDPARHLALATEYMQAGRNIEALARYEAAITCKHDPAVEVYATLAACRAKLYDKARRHLVRVADPAKHDQLARICAGPYY